jgi:hypothetical protein
MHTSAASTPLALSAPDTPTLVSVSALAYVLAVAIHEHGGHAVACVLMGSHPKELGAFYVECDSGALTGFGMRVVALAGPVASLLTGVIAFLAVRRIPPGASLPYYFTWLLGAIGLMSAAGYPLFSGVSGLGDLGTTRDGAFFGATPEVAWRIGLTLAGFAAYSAVARYMCRTIAPCAGRIGGRAIAIVRRATLVSYLAGAAVYFAIGALNPMGWTILLMSVLPSSLGGTSALLWMWPIYRRRRPTLADGEGIRFARNPVGIGASVIVVLAYAVVFGPTWRF